MSETFEDRIEGLPDWEFSGTAEIDRLVRGWVVEALRNSLPDSWSLWMDTEPLAIKFYLELGREAAVVCKRSLADIVMEHAEDTFSMREEDKAEVASLAQGLRSIADQVDAFIVAKEAQEGRK